MTREQIEAARAAIAAQRPGEWRDYEPGGRERMYAPGNHAAWWVPTGRGDFRWDAFERGDEPVGTGAASTSAEAEAAADAALATVPLPEPWGWLEAALDEVERLRAGGAGLIAAERVRQITAEGWTPEHDDEHDNGSLTEAAIMYARYGYGPLPPKGSPPLGWPWDVPWWKPTPGDRVRALVKAGALLAAEIDRLLRGGR